MDTPRFARLRVSSRREETPELTLLRVSGDPASLFAAHRMPGQFAALRLPEAEKPSYMAIASAPGEPFFEFLVRGGGRFAEALRGLRPGDTVEVSEPMGEGFPLAEALGREAWLVAAGSGLAALRPLARALLKAPELAGRLHLLVGARDREALPFRADLASWSEAGLEVTLALSRAAADEDLGIETGYVQDVLARRAPDLSQAVLFVCGMGSMVEAVRAVAIRLAHGDARVFTNH